MTNIKIKEDTRETRAEVKRKAGLREIKKLRKLPESSFVSRIQENARRVRQREKLENKQ